jgi:hypothetical protein
MTHCISPFDMTIPRVRCIPNIAWTTVIVRCRQRLRRGHTTRVSPLVSRWDSWLGSLEPVAGEEAPSRRRRIVVAAGQAQGGAPSRGGRGWSRDRRSGSCSWQWPWGVSRSCCASACGTGTDRWPRSSVKPANRPPRDVGRGQSEPVPSQPVALPWLLRAYEYPFEDVLGSTRPSPSRVRRQPSSRWTWEATTLAQR